MKESKLGEVRKNNFGTPMKIIRYRKKADIDVQFLDEHEYIVKNTIYQNFKLGQIKNPYDKTVYNVGYLGEGQHPTKINGIRLYKYACWHDMLLRCYGEKQKHKHPAYYGKVTVCEEWHNYQKFAEWYDSNYYELGEGRMHLDKDILLRGNKEYSPNACVFVPQRINMLFASHKANKFGLPEGIGKTQNGRYSASYNGKSLGTFETLENAYNAYSKIKEKTIKLVAEEYKNKIPKNLFEALISYKVYLE